jgi:predicted transcriptional regulator
MDFSQDELFEAIDRLVNGMLERSGVVKPPVNALDLAENHLGIPVEVVEPVEADERGRPRPRLRRTSAGIVLSSDMTEEQQQKKAADGIARTFLADILGKLGVSPGTENKQLASHIRALFVSRLLVPHKLLRTALKECRYDLLELKKVFNTATVEMIALRLLDLDEPCVIAIVDDGVVTVRRGNRATASTKLGPAEQTCLNRVMELDLPHRLRAGEWTVQAWPVPDRPLRRIILRAVPDDV